MSEKLSLREDKKLVQGHIISFLKNTVAGNLHFFGSKSSVLPPLPHPRSHWNKEVKETEFWFSSDLFSKVSFKDAHPHTHVLYRQQI